MFFHNGNLLYSWRKFCCWSINTSLKLPSLLKPGFHGFHIIVRIVPVVLKTIYIEIYGNTENVLYCLNILRKDNLNLLKNKTLLSWQLWKKHCQVTARTQCAPFLKISRISSIPPAKYPVSLQFFNLNIPYPDGFSAFWLRLVSRPGATVKYHCTFFRAVWGRHRTVSAVCLFPRDAITRVCSARV